MSHALRSLLRACSLVLPIVALLLSACGTDSSSAAGADVGPDSTPDAGVSDADGDTGAEDADAGPGLDNLCETLPCDGGACDAQTGTCICPTGTWFDGRDCAPVEICGALACTAACPVPRAPVLDVLGGEPTLTFDAGDHEVLVAATASLELDRPATWESGPTLALDGFSGPTRVFARVADEACDGGPYFNAVITIAPGYPGPPDSPDTTAVASDDGRIVGWASVVAAVDPGEEVDPPFDDPANALGPAEGDAMAVYSLGRGGSVTLTFGRVIADGPGPDFAVYENGFQDDYLELASVAVSSDGVHFVAFDIASQTPEAVGAYGTLDTTALGQIAGKYRRGWGTPFDLATLRQRPDVREGRLDPSAVTHVRVTDIVGDGTTLDVFGRPIFDAYPTVGSAGFDLDAVAILGMAP